MDGQNKDTKTSILFATIFFVVSLVLWTFYYFFGSTFLLGIAIFVTMLGISIGTRPIQQYRIVKVYDFVFGWIIGLMYLAATLVMSLILLFMSFYLIWNLLTVSLRGLAWIIDYFQIYSIDWKEVKKPIFYISTLVTAVSISYYGDNILILLDKMFKYASNNKKDEISKNLALLLNKYIDFRRRCYEVSIVLYIISVIEKLSNANLIPYSLWLTYKTVALEVLLSFVAIDNYIRNYPRKKKAEIDS